MSTSEVESFTEQFKAIEEWIENENERTMSTAKDLELYESQLEKIKTYERALNVLQDRKEAGKTLITKYHKVKQYMEGIPLQEKVHLSVFRVCGKRESWVFWQSGSTIVLEKCKHRTGKDTIWRTRVWSLHRRR